MKIERLYPDRKSLEQADEIYREALYVLNMLYLEPPMERLQRLSCSDVIDYFMMSCVHTIVNILTENRLSFPSVFEYCRRETFENVNCDSMRFDNFYVNADYKHAALFGAIYYVLARQQKIDQCYIDYIEKTFTTDERLKAYFQPFKDAALKKLKEQEDSNKKGKEVKKSGKGLSPAQAGLFCEAWLDYHHCTYSNKKETIPPLASSLFGWTPSTMERYGSTYSQEDRDYVAGLFENSDSEFSDHVRHFGKKEAQINSPSGDTKKRKK